MKFLDRIIKSTYWKLLAVVLLILLLLLVARLVLIAHYSLGVHQKFGILHQEPWVRTVSEVYIWGIVAAALLFMILIAGVLDMVSLSLLAKRFRAITEVINDFTEGNLSRRVDLDRYKGYRDIIKLARAFNQMADTLVANIDELKRTDKLRRELVANVAHDLGTPVTSIRGFVETILLKDPELSGRQRRKYLEIIRSNTAALSVLVSELVELSKLDASDVVPNAEKFSIVTLAQDVISRFMAKAEELKIALAVLIDDEIPLVFADLALIERVLSNIIENAVNYSRPGGMVQVYFKVDEARLWVSIKDTGIGIPSEDLPYIFDRFYRVGQDRSRATGGSGLGLAIAKKIMDVHNCKIFVSSEIEKGTLVSFELPLAGKGKTSIPNPLG